MGKKKKGFSKSQIIGLHYPKGFNVIYFPWWIFFIELFLGAFVIFLVIRRFGISNEWIRCLMTFLIYIPIFFVGHKVFYSTLNLRITPSGLEVTRVKGFVFVPKHRVIKWKSMKRCYLWGRTYKSTDFIIKTRTGRNFRIYESVFSFCKAIKDSNKTLSDFRIAFEKAAKSHGVKTLTSKNMYN
ncbi:MAG: hypothetical protein MJZ97_00160 [Bacteroidales bacterium]|nr:hypothetical protein [Bacteroidales bacterium]